MLHVNKHMEENTVLKSNITKNGCYKNKLKVAVLVTGILGLIIDQLGYYCLRIHVVSAAQDHRKPVNQGNERIRRAYA